MSVRALMQGLLTLGWLTLRIGSLRPPVAHIPRSGWLMWVVWGWFAIMVALRWSDDLLSVVPRALGVMVLLIIVSKLNSLAGQSAVGYALLSIGVDMVAMALPASIPTEPAKYVLLGWEVAGTFAIFVAVCRSDSGDHPA